MTDKFPGWRYGPNGQEGIFQSEADVPKGWTDNPNDFKKDDDEGDGGAGGDADFDRAAAVAKLEAAGVKVRGNWGDKRIQAEVAKLPA